MLGLRAFLRSRFQWVVIDGEELESIPVTSGFPQDSVLGPILFLIYINYLQSKACSQVRLFADDKALYLTTLQNEFNILSAWHGVQPLEIAGSTCEGIQ